jgi:hypothetical protein
MGFKQPRSLARHPATAKRETDSDQENIYIKYFCFCQDNSLPLSFRYRQQLHCAPAVDPFGAASLGPLLRGRRPQHHPFGSAKQASPLKGSFSGRAFL